MTIHLAENTARDRDGTPHFTTVLDVVIPVHNEQETLAASVLAVYRHLQEQFAYPFRLTIADNASSDATLTVARRLEQELPAVRATHSDRKGRGHALRTAWLASDALVLAYMDVDLSTDLDALAPLVAPLMSGHSDVAIGSRLARGANVVRGLKRDVISRGCNRMLRASLGVGFTDAQCGFKAIRADVARELLPLVADDTWFFDTELLVLAERAGLRIHEVPVDWCDDPDGRVDLLSTTKAGLRGVRRMRSSRRSQALLMADINIRMGRGRVVCPGRKRLALDLS